MTEPIEVTFLPFWPYGVALWCILGAALMAAAVLHWGPGIFLRIRIHRAKRRMYWAYEAFASAWARDLGPGGRRRRPWSPAVAQLYSEFDEAVKAHSSIDPDFTRSAAKYLMHFPHQVRWWWQ
jgi:hypothetical protein